MRPSRASHATAESGDPVRTNARAMAYTAPGWLGAKAMTARTCASYSLKLPAAAARSANREWQNTSQGGGLCADAAWPSAAAASARTVWARPDVIRYSLGCGNFGVRVELKRSH